MYVNQYYKHKILCFLFVDERLCYSMVRRKYGFPRATYATISDVVSSDILYSVYDANHGLDVKQLSPEGFGLCVRRWRKMNHLTVQNLASRLGLSPTWVFVVERGMNDRPYSNNFIVLCYLMRFTVFDIEFLLYRFGYHTVFFENKHYFNLVLWKGSIEGKDYELTALMLWNWFKGCSRNGKFLFDRYVYDSTKSDGSRWRLYRSI